MSKMFKADWRFMKDGAYYWPHNDQLFIVKIRGQSAKFEPFVAIIMSEHHVWPVLKRFMEFFLSNAVYIGEFE